MKLRRLKNGRVKDMDTGLFVNKREAKSFANGKKIPLLKSKKSTKRNNKSRKHAAVKMVVRKYHKNKDTDYFEIDFGGASDGDLLYIAEMMRNIATGHADKESKNID